MTKYEYIGKREILRRASDLGYQVAPGKFCSYSKFEGVEWLECVGYKITVQRGGEWLQVIASRYDPDFEETITTCRTFTGYSANGYKVSY